MHHTLIVDRQTQNLLHITLNRPKALNALNIALLSELKKVLTEAQEDKSLRLIVIEGNSKAFAAGADITEIKGLSEPEAFEFSQSGQKIFDTIENLKIPTLACISGYALGGGLELAMSCHLRICNESAKLGMPEINLGLLPGYAGTQRLPRLIGVSKATEMILTGKMIDGRAAQTYGLVGTCFPDEEYEFQKDKMIHTLLSKAPLSVNKILQSIREAYFQNENGAKLESNFFGQLMNTKDLNEGISAFLEKRKAHFIGE